MTDIRDYPDQEQPTKTCKWCGQAIIHEVDWIHSETMITDCGLSAEPKEEDEHDAK